MPPSFVNGVAVTNLAAARKKKINKNESRSPPTIAERKSILKSQNSFNLNLHFPRFNPTLDRHHFREESLTFFRSCCHPRNGVGPSHLATDDKKKQPDFSVVGSFIEFPRSFHYLMENKETNKINETHHELIQSHQKAMQPVKEDTNQVKPNKTR